ncbi:response regulator transcription factor [Propioniciclava sinopodophylli]|uniref:Response regulator transcription factor n=1 Tax=Propioniciclava sinopodophylli TaxID=1837344 RepID=A0A4Q9KH35_9ACTN|nr:response regulator transcription factor [Propioniciclava sinopodophylli]TBT88660.1 response regulator transcription factor [Propioniciclava sinopodophylli]
MTVTVVLADDQPMVRAGVRMLLSVDPAIQVVGEASDGHEAIAAVERLRPDVIVMDLRMPGTDGAEATRRIVAEQEHTPDALTRVLVLTTFDEDADVYAALRAGASGFLLKHASADVLATAIRRVAEGESWLDPAVVGRVIRALRLPPGPDGAAVAAVLTPREREVLTLVAEGLSNAELCDRLFLSEATVKTHVARVLMKTGSRDRAAAVALAYRSGFVRPPA